ncbi:MAG TPA: choice-of-anchor tandem repeat GloVer-containing protein [Terriglobales bacterium]|nr:choice-of-anchor tandem repeat GloVer-containing protein [Terriglobales bacterium]
MNYMKYLTALSKCCAVAAVTMGLAASSLGAGSETVLHTFTNGSDGSFPFSGLTLDTKGNLYGTTDTGGGGEFADGTVFQLTPKAGGGFNFQTIHAFSQAKGDGGNPAGSVVLDAAGNIYGTTSNGQIGGCGIVYELSPSKGGTYKETILHKFRGNNDGCNSSGFVILDEAGNLFGATASGGGGVNNTFCNHGCGTVFELTKNANGTFTEKVIHRFTGKNEDGRNPLGGLVFDKSGNLWGTTQVGGHSHSSTCGGADVCGTVFELTPNANGTWTESTLFSFSDNSTGFNPVTNLVVDDEGNLYGTTVNGGPSLEGLVFKLTPEGNGKVTESIVHDFGGPCCTDGVHPFNGLTIDAVGNLYGAVQGGGGTTTVCTGGFVDTGCGIVYKLTPNASKTTWEETILYAFFGESDGATPLDDHVAVDANGNVFGSASAGGDFDFNQTHCAGSHPGGCGVVFEVKP